MFGQIEYIKRAYRLLIVKQIKLEETEITTVLSYEKLRSLIGKSVEAEKFKSMKTAFHANDISNIDFWCYRNINMNRSVITLKCTKSMKLDDLIKYVQDIKMRLGKATGYVPFFNEVGMQVIVYCDSILDSEHALKPVDTLNNQRVIVQSLFLIDIKNKKYYRAFSEMQTVTSRVQNIIDRTIVDEVCN